VRRLVRFERTESGAVEGLDDGIGGPPPVPALDDGEAAAVHRDRVADPGVLEHGRGFDLEARAAFAPVDGPDPSELLDDPREHLSRLPARTRGARRRRAAWP